METLPNQAKVSQLVKDHPELFDGVEHGTKRCIQRPCGFKSAISPAQRNNMLKMFMISHMKPKTSRLSIEKKEKELIIRALRKNNNKRKYAARDLGISERTLYRKIKQYDLED